LARKKSKGTTLRVFSDRAGRANSAIFDALAQEGNQCIKDLLKKISKVEGLEEMYFASLNKRLKKLLEEYLIQVNKPAERGSAANYDLSIKGFLAIILRDNGIQQIFDKANDKGAALMVFAFMYVLYYQEG